MGNVDDWLAYGWLRKPDLPKRDLPDVTLAVRTICNAIGVDYKTVSSLTVGADGTLGITAEFDGWEAYREFRVVLNG